MPAYLDCPHRSLWNASRAASQLVCSWMLPSQLDRGNGPLHTVGPWERSVTFSWTVGTVHYIQLDRGNGPLHSVGPWERSTTFSWTVGTVHYIQLDRGNGPLHSVGPWERSSDPVNVVEHRPHGLPSLSPRSMNFYWRSPGNLSYLGTVRTV